MGVGPRECGRQRRSILLAALLLVGVAGTAAAEAVVTWSADATAEAAGLDQDRRAALGDGAPSSSSALVTWDEQRSLVGEVQGAGSESALETEATSDRRCCWPGGPARFDGSCWRSLASCRRRRSAAPRLSPLRLVGATPCRARAQGTTSISPARSTWAKTTPATSTSPRVHARQLVLRAGCLVFAALLRGGGFVGVRTV
jgi:hypothetical protein